MLGSVAFSPVKNDMLGNVKVSKGEREGERANWACPVESPREGYWFWRQS